MIPDAPMEIRGGAAGLWDHECDQTVVLEGGVNTGKTHGWGMYALDFGERFPGARILILRKVRADLIQSTLIKPWESSIIDKHLRLGLITIRGGESRREYVHRNGSIWVPGGLDKSSRHMGAQWDVVIFVEATEATVGDYEDLLTRTSRESGAAPFSFIILDVNPGTAVHWINQKAHAGHIKRLLSRHEDNPNLFDIAEYDESGAACRFSKTPQGEKFLAKLDTLPPGARRDRLRDHIWATAEGLVWPEYGSAHYRSRDDVIPRLKVGRIVAGFDWGHTEPAALEVWAIDKRNGQTYRVFECYRRQQGLQWWAQRFIDVYRMCRETFGRGIDDLVYSHERPEQVEFVNALLRASDLPGFVRQYKRPSPARRIEVVRWFWQPTAAPDVAEAPEHGEPMAFLLSGSRLWPPLDEDELGLAPKSLEDEIPGYVWAPTPDQRRSKEEVDPKCPNHACDAAGMALEAALRYVLNMLGADSERDAAHADGTLAGSVAADAAVFEQPERRDRADRRDRTQNRNRNRTRPR